jgi:hypothetical protein
MRISYVDSNSLKPNMLIQILIYIMPNWFIIEANTWYLVV